MAAGEGGAAQKSRRRQPGSVCGPGARTRKARGCGATRAAGPSSCGAAAAGCRRWRNRGWGARPVQAAPAAPARHPADRPGAGTAPRPGAWRRSPRASLPRCGGPPSRAGAGSPAALSGDVWGRGLGRRGFPACHTLAWGKDWDGQSLVGAPRGSENCTRSRAPETGSGDLQGPVGSTWVDPELGAVVGSPIAVACAPLCHHTNAGTQRLAATRRWRGWRRERAGEGRGAGMVGGGPRLRCGRGGRGREAPEGFGPAAAAAPQSPPGAEEAAAGGVVPAGHTAVRVGVNLSSE